MRLINFLKETTVIDQLRNNVVDDRTDMDREQDELDNRTYPNPLPHLSPNDDRWMEWHDRGDEVFPHGYRIIREFLVRVREGHGEIIRFHPGKHRDLNH